MLGRVAVTAFVLGLAQPLPAGAHGDLHDQIQAVSRRIELSPLDAALYLKRGDLHRLHREWEAALRDFDRAAELDPRLGTLGFRRGVTLLEAGLTERARAVLDAFLAEHPDHIDALGTRAKALGLLGEHRAAAADLTRVIERVPRPLPEHYLDRARALASDGRVAEAVRGLDEGLARLGPIVTLGLAAIDLEVEQARFAAALARLDRIVASAARKETWLARRSEILEQAGRPDAAREDIHGALAAIDALPRGQRATRAVSALEARLYAALERLAARSAD